VVYESLSEIFEALHNTRERIYARVEALGPEQYSYKEEGGWSVAGVIEHIGAAEARIVSRVRASISRAETAGELGPASNLFQPISPDEIRSRSTLTQFQAPPDFVPKRESPLDELVNEIKASRAELLELRPKFEQLNLSNLRFPHPAFGPLDLYEWLALVVLHEDRHLNQIERILACPDFPARVCA